MMSATVWRRASRELTSATGEGCDGAEDAFRAGDRAVAVLVDAAGVRRDCAWSTPEISQALPGP